MQAKCAEKDAGEVPEVQRSTERLACRASGKCCEGRGAHLLSAVNCYGSAISPAEASLLDALGPWDNSELALLKERSV